MPFSYFQHPIPSFELEGNSELSRWYISHKMYLIENSEKLLNKLAYCNNYYWYNLVDRLAEWILRCARVARWRLWTTATVGSKIIRALEKILAIFLWFDCQFLSSHACYKAELSSDLTNIYFIKLHMSFLTGIISRTRIILLPTVAFGCGDFVIYT